MNLRPETEIVVTGIGILSPIGIGAPHFWSALTQGISGIRPVAGATAAPTVAAQLVDYVPRDLIRTPHLRRMDKVSRALVAAARLAVDDAGVGAESLASDRCGIVVGTVYGNLGESAQYFQRFVTKGPALASPMLFPNLVLNAPASYAAMELGCVGPNLTVCSGETSGESALAQACMLITTGKADIVLAGGVDEIDDVSLEGYRGFRALSSQRGGREWGSPYDTRRNGVVLGEGAAVLVLESATHARARRATALATIRSVLQFGVPASTFDWPRRSGIAATRLRAWLKRSAAKVGAVFGSANSSRWLDTFELAELGDVFGEAAASVALTSIKGAIGEFSAAGALTGAAAALAVRHGTIPPLCNLEEADPAATLSLVQRATPRSDGSILQLGVARGGGCVALLWETPT